MHHDAGHFIYVSWFLWTFNVADQVPMPTIFHAFLLREDWILFVFIVSTFVLFYSLSWSNHKFC